MSSLPRLDEGRWPWEPNGEARLAQVLDQVDVPTEGILVEDGNAYLFRCIDGLADRLSLWVFAPYTHRTPEVNESHDDTVAALLRAAPVVSFALADSSTGIVRAVEKVEPSMYPSLLAAAVRSLELSSEEQAVLGIEDRELLAP